MTQAQPNLQPRSSPGGSEDDDEQGDQDGDANEGWSGPLRRSLVRALVLGGAAWLFFDEGRTSWLLVALVFASVPLAERVLGVGGRPTSRGIASHGLAVFAYVSLGSAAAFLNGVYLDASWEGTWKTGLDAVDLAWKSQGEPLAQDPLRQVFPWHRLWTWVGSGGYLVAISCVLGLIGLGASLLQRVGALVRTFPILAGAIGVGIVTGLLQPESVPDYQVGASSGEATFLQAECLVFFVASWFLLSAADFHRRKALPVPGPGHAPTPLWVPLASLLALAGAFVVMVSIPQRVFPGPDERLREAVASEVGSSALVAAIASLSEGHSVIATGEGGSELIVLLGHRDPGVRESALILLGWRSTLTGEMAEAILNRAEEDPEPRLRQYAAEAFAHLARLGVEFDVERLAALCADPDPEIRGPLLEALVLLDETRALPRLRVGLADLSSRVRVHAAVGARNSSPATRQALSGQLLGLLDDPSSEVYSAACSALPDSLSKVQVEALANAYRERGGDAPLWRLRGLAPSQLRPVLSVIVAGFEGHEEGRDMALYTFAELGRDAGPAVPAIKQLLARDYLALGSWNHSQVPSLALDALTAIGTSAAHDALNDLADQATSPWMCTKMAAALRGPPRR